MSSLELKIPPIALVAIFTLAMTALAYLATGFSLDIPYSEVISAVFVFSGCAIVLAGVITFRKHQTTVNPLTPEASSTIVTTGVYGFSRNPMYLGFSLVLAGVAAYTNNIASIALVPVFIVYMTEFQIKPEERALHAKFRETFSRYTATVRRWV